MNILGFIKKQSKKVQEDLKNKTIIPIENGIIPYDKIKDKKDIAFVIITQDKKVLEDTIQAIANIHKENENMNVTIFISSSYEKLQKISNNKF